MKANDSDTLSPDTVHSYIAALKKIFVVEDAIAWNPNLRSQTAIRTSDTKYFVDPSIAAAALGFGLGDLMEDLETCGLMFETMAIRDLRIYADALDGTVYHYRDKTGLECDAVIHLRNGSYGLIEIKLGGERLIEEGAASLKKLAGRIDTTKMQKPSFMMVLTSNSDIAYKRDDGFLLCLLAVWEYKCLILRAYFSCNIFPYTKSEISSSFAGIGAVQGHAYYFRAISYL